MEKELFDLYLSSINDVLPCSACLVVGSGSGSYVETLKGLHFENVVLVDADVQQLEKMQKMHTLPANYVLEEALIYKESEALAFNIATNPTLNCFKPVETYKILMPNVETVESIMIPSYSLDSFVHKLELSKSNWLIIDTFTSLEILEHAEKTLGHLDVVVCRVMRKASENLQDFMSNNGFKQVKSFEQNNPGIGIEVFTKDLKKQMLTLKEEKETEKTEYEKQLVEKQQTIKGIQETSIKEQQSLKEKLENLTKELQENVNKERAAKEALQKELSEIRTQLENKTNEIQTLQEQHEESKKSLETKIQEQENFKDLNEIKAKEQLELQQKLKVLEAQELKIETILKAQEANFQKHTIDKNYFDTLKKEIIDKARYFSANSSKQIEAFIGLENYLIHGQQQLNFHGWPISPDIALFLIEKIELNDYDLVLEFGSGTSTLLFANVLKNKYKRSKNSKKTRQVAFDHHEKYYAQTRESLKSNKLLKGVELVHAPLEEYKLNEEMFMYYSCREKFQELKDDESIQSVLVLVDGPPGATGPLARLPALSYLLEAFKDKKIHLVLDDYDREEEKNIAKKWEQSLEKMSISFISESIPSEKGLYFCQIN